MGIPCQRSRFRKSCESRGELINSEKSSQRAAKWPTDYCGPCSISCSVSSEGEKQRSREPLSRVPLGGGLENHRRQILAMGRSSLRDTGRTDGLHVISCWGKGAVSIPIYAYANRLYPLGPDPGLRLVRHGFFHEGDRQELPRHSRLQ